jgi:hypothetical protein
MTPAVRKLMQVPRPTALQSSNRAALYFVPPSQGEGAEGGGEVVIDEKKLTLAIKR